MTYLSLTGQSQWIDDCEYCPAHIEFQNAAECGAWNYSDGRCFRGDWDRDNDYLEYLFELPTEMQLPITFWLHFTFWALGSWDNDTGGREVAVARHCDESSANCEQHLYKKRSNTRECTGWKLWEDPGDSPAFTPWIWDAVNTPFTWRGTACFWDMTVPVSDWAYSKVRVFFGVWNEVTNDWGLTSAKGDEAYVLSDVSIDFLPMTTSTTELPTTTTKTPTTTTKTPTTTTATPTTTTKTPTTTTKTPTTTTKMPTTTTTKLPTTTTKTPTATKLPSSTAAATSTELTTSTEETSTEPPTTTLNATNFEFLTTFETTATEVNGKGNGGDGMMLYAAIGGAVLSTLLCILGLWWLRRKKGAQPKDGDSDTAPERVWSVSSAPVVEMAPPSAVPVSEDSFVPGSKRVSHLMRTGVVALSGMQPTQKQRPSLLLSASGLVLPTPPEPKTRMFPPPSKADATRSYDDFDDLYHNDAGEGVGGYTYCEQFATVAGGKVPGETYTTGEDYVREGHSGDTGAMKREMSAALKKMILEMKIEARTAKERTIARTLDLALSAERRDMEEEFQALVQMGVDSTRVTELLLDKAENILVVKGIHVTKCEAPAKDASFGKRSLYIRDASDEQREDSEELYDAGVATGIGTHGAAAESLEAVIAKKQLAARSGEETAIAKKLRMALTLAPLKMEEEFRALLQMGANIDEVVLILADTAHGILRAKHVDF